MTISPTSNLLENPPAEPVLITRDGLKRSCKIVVVIAALTFPIPDFNNTTSTPDSFPFTHKQLATVTSCWSVILFLNRLISSSIAPFIPIVMIVTSYSVIDFFQYFYFRRLPAFSSTQDRYTR